jgi:preprotein translocase subunit YajC
MGMLPLLLMFVIIYFFFIRPSVKKQKEQNKFQEELEKGKEVVTSSGIIGKITKIDDNTVTLNVNEKTSIRFTKGAISKEMTDAYSSNS